MMKSNSEWMKVVNAMPGDVLWEYYDPQNDVRGYVIRGPMALCGYVGTREDHAIWRTAREEANKGVFRELYDSFPVLRMHGGLTYGGRLERTAVHVTGYYFVGWDYAHSGDATIHDFAVTSHGYKWTVPKVAAHVRDAIVTFTNYKQLIERMEAGLCDKSALELFERLEE